jgi:hypothetical protein
LIGMWRWSPVLREALGGPSRWPLGSAGATVVGTATTQAEGAVQIGRRTFVAAGIKGRGAVWNR